MSKAETNPPISDRERRAAKHLHLSNKNQNRRRLTSAWSPHQLKLSEFTNYQMSQWQRAGCPGLDTEDITVLDRFLQKICTNEFKRC